MGVGIWGGFIVVFFCMIILICLWFFMIGMILLNIWKFSGFEICIVISFSV